MYSGALSTFCASCDYVHRFLLRNRLMVCPKVTSHSSRSSSSHSSTSLISLSVCWLFAILLGRLPRPVLKEVYVSHYSRIKYVLVSFDLIENITQITLHDCQFAVGKVEQVELIPEI
jgi:hypothetical protein